MGIRILHILDHSIPLHSGYGFRTLAILREQHALGWQTIQLTTPKQGPGAAEVENVDGWQFHRTPSAPGVGLLNQMRLTARRIASLIESEQPAILHAHSPVLNALPALWAGRAYRLPVVYEMRASWEDAALDHGTTTAGSIRYRLSRWLETFALRRANQITTICEGLRNDIAARGVPEDKITVIPNAVDVDAFKAGRPPDELLRRELGLSGATVLGFVGSFYAYEGIDLIIRALSALIPKHPNLKLLLVGGGSHERDLRQIADQLGIAQHVVFAGRVPNSQVQRYYDLIDLLAYPRRSMRLTELVTPLKPLEAMAQGKLFVASDVGGHRELVRDGQTGFLFTAGDVDALVATISRVLDSPELGPRIRAAGRKFVENERTWKLSVARYADVYSRAQGQLRSGSVTEQG